jgi:phosphoribosylformimino-5-aminoimidazole carboxamide ribotide isomerase
MRIIPVVDLQNGVVVRAVKGERERYLPLESALCRSSDPVRVARICSNTAPRASSMPPISTRSPAAPRRFR